MKDQKRVFFGFEAQAPWPEKFPVGRLLDPLQRHMTVAFLGNIHYHDLEQIFDSLPKPDFTLGFAGYFDECLLLPPRHPHVVAWHVRFAEQTVQTLNAFYEQFTAALKSAQLLPEREDRPWLPHVTLCRSPFDPHHWKKQFTPLPVIFTRFNLYESIGELKYPTLWSQELLPSFEEISHTADIAFAIRGRNVNEIYQHALTALAFKHPPLVKYLALEGPVETLDDVIIKLNEVVALSDEESGCSFKAVSYHGELIQDQNGIYTWEMIVDV